MKVEKNGIVKTIENEILAKQYIAVGWKEVKEDKKVDKPKEEKNEKKW